MIKATVKPKIKETKYYDTETDEMWLLEVECLMPWMSGKGIDVGCGARTFSKDILRVDIDKAVKPDIVASGDKMPLKDEEFDYLISIHSFEHFENPKKVLTEWLRVLKVGGVIGIVHPDINYTKKQNPEIDNAGLRENPYNKHYFEHTPESLIEKLKEWEDLPFRVIDYGVACNEWSFYVILRKK